MISEARLQAQPRWLFWGQSTRLLPRIAAICLLLAATAWLAFGLWSAMQQSERIGELQKSISSIDQSMRIKAPYASSGNFSAVSSKASFTNPASLSREGSLEQRRQINGVIRQLNTPWHHLFEQLESNTPKDMSLISIEPDAKRGSIRLQAEARTLDTLLTYAARLQFQGVLGALTYSKHETNEQDPNKPIRLSVEYGLQALPAAPASSPRQGGQK